MSESPGGEASVLTVLPSSGVDLPCASNTRCNAHVISERITIVLGPEESRAARRLAARWGVTPSEAIRRALMRVANEELEEHRERKRRQRVASLERLIELSDGQDLEAELKRISDERDAW